MYYKFVFLVLAVAYTIAQGNNSDEDYVDAVINMLLNGVSVDEKSEEDSDGQEPVLHGGIWKCGMCDDLDDSRIVYSEDNEVDADMAGDETVEVQIGFTVQDMRCVTVTADVTGIVRRVTGACTGTSVTLNVSPVHNFTVKVYN